jgi:hypothetical protein
VVANTQYTTEGTIKTPNLLEETQEDLLSAGKSLLTGNTAGMMSSLFGAAKGAFESNQAHEKTKKTKTSSADVVMWSGCKDSQTVGSSSLLSPASISPFSSRAVHHFTPLTFLLIPLSCRYLPAFQLLPPQNRSDRQSADTQEEGAATGAMSYAFISSLKKNPRQSYQGLLQTIREELKGESSSYGR